MDTENAHRRKASDAKIGAGETDWCLKYFLHTHEHLSSDSQCPYKKTWCNNS